MGASYLIAFLLSFYPITPLCKTRFKNHAPSIPTIPGVAAACALICLLFALKLHIVNMAAHNFSNLPSYVRDLPIPAVQSSTTYNNVDAFRANIVETICITQSFLLLALVFLLQRNDAQTRLVGIFIASTATILAILALFSPAMEGVDLYLYVGQALATPNAYHPNIHLLPGEYAIINKMWGLPLCPSAYGPLWIFLDKLVTTPMPTLVTKLFALRFLGLIAIALCIALLISLKFPRWTLAVFAINPAIYDIFVSEGHNDIFGTLFVLAATTAYRRSPAVAVALAATAGTFKLPFILIGALAFTIERNIARRINFGAISACLACAISLLAGGPWYLWALHRVTILAEHPTLLLERLLHVACEALAIGFLLLAITRKRFFPGAVWSIPSLSLGVLSQYLAWSIPYALLAEEANCTFFAMLPIAAYLLNTQYEVTPFFIFLRTAIVAVPTIGIIHLFLRRKPDNQPSQHSNIPY